MSDTQTMESILRKVEYDKFIKIKNENDKYKVINFDNINSFSMTQIGKRQIGLFNELLLFAHKNFGIDIFSVLIELANNVLDVTKIKYLVNNDVKWLLAENISENYNFQEDTTLSMFI